MQSATAFGQIHDSLSFFRNAYDEFASYRAAIIRLDGMLQENSRARAFTAVQTATSADGALEVDGVEVRTPDGEYLVNSLDLRLEPGDALLITGPSGIGKTVLLQSLAGLWPFVSGSVALPGTPAGHDVRAATALHPPRRPPRPSCRIPTRRAPSTTARSSRP